MEAAIVIVALIALVGLRLWLQHHRRIMTHRERLAAIEKGLEVPPIEQEIRWNNWKVQRILLLLGLIWISIGVTLFVVLATILSQPQPNPHNLPQGIQWLGVGPVAIGLSHLIVYFVGKRREN
jgi:hypothetical protein